MPVTFAEITSAFQWGFFTSYIAINDIELTFEFIYLFNNAIANSKAWDSFSILKNKGAK